MATSTYNLQCIQSVQIFKHSPDRKGAAQANEYHIYGGSDDIEAPVLLGFEAFPENLRYKKIIRASVGLYLKQNSSYNFAHLDTPPDGFPGFNWPDTSWNTARAYGSWNLYGVSALEGRGDYALYNVPSGYSSHDTAADISLKTVRALRSKSFWLESGAIGSSSYIYLDIARSAVMTVEYDTEAVDTKIKATSHTSASGFVPPYLNPHIANTFTWKFDWAPTDDYTAVGPITQASAVFYWRVGSSGDWNQIAINSSAESITIPAETFTGGTVVTWKVAGTDTEGQTSETPVYILSIVDTSRTSKPIEPVSVIVTDDEPTVFRWTSSNSHGTAQTGADLQYSLAGGTWTDLAHIDGDGTEYIAPIGTFEAGNYQWRVRTYNVDGNAGGWSDPASFIYMVAPEVTSLYATSAPFSTILWQSTNQQAYKIAVDGVSLGTFFGTDKSYTLQDFLEDGEHTVQVAVQNSVSLWSETASYTFTVANVPGDEVTLQGQFAIDAALSWYTESAISNFLVYRDGKKIGSSNSNIFTDRFALGEHSYFVINVLAGGYYTKSNVVTGVMKACVTVIDTVQNPSGWMELKLTANDPDEQIFSYTRTSSLRHFTGAALPVLELSKYEDGSGVYNVAFKDLTDANAFEALKGQVVIVKSRGGNVIIGALTQLQKRMGDFFIVFDFTLQRIYWEDFVNDQND